MEFAKNKDGLCSILIIVFNSFCFSLVSVSWLPLHLHRDFSIHVMVLYTLTMIVGMIATLRAWLESKPTLAGNEKHAVSIVRIIGLSAFLVATMFMDILTIIEFFFCIPSFFRLGCPETWSKVSVLVMLLVKIIYLGTQTVNFLWLMPKLSAGNGGLSTKGHLVNVAINIALLIHNLLFEFKSIFQGGESELLPLCLAAEGHKSGDVIMARQCFYGTHYIPTLRRQAEEFLRPMMSEYFFLASTILINQWLAMNKNRSCAQFANGGIHGNIVGVHGNSESINGHIRRLRRSGNEKYDGCSDFRQPPRLRPPTWRHSSSNDATMDDESHRLEPSNPGGHCSFFIMLTVGIATALLGLVKLSHLWIVDVLYDAFNTFVMTFGSCLIIVHIRRALKINTRVLQNRKTLHFDYEMWIFSISSCGIFIQNIARILPYLACLLWDDLWDEVVDKMMKQDTDMNLLSAHFVLIMTEFASEIVLTAAVVIYVFLLENDMKTCHIQRNSPPSFRGNMYIIIFGSFAFWAYKSFVTMTQKQAAILSIFYVEDEWSLMLHILNPVSVYFHFHTFLVCTEYLTSCFRSARRNSSAI